MACSSVAVKVRRSKAATFSTSCWGLEAPTNTLVTASSRNTQAKAIWDRDCPLS